MWFAHCMDLERYNSCKYSSVCASVHRDDCLNVTQFHLSCSSIRHLADGIFQSILLVPSCLVSPYAAF